MIRVRRIVVGMATCPTEVPSWPITRIDETAVRQALFYDLAFDKPCKDLLAEPLCIFKTICFPVYDTLRVFTHGIPGTLSALLFDADK